MVITDQAAFSLVFFLRIVLKRGIKQSPYAIAIRRYHDIIGDGFPLLNVGDRHE